MEEGGRGGEREQERGEGGEEEVRSGQRQRSRYSPVCPSLGLDEAPCQGSCKPIPVEAAHGGRCSAQDKPDDATNV